MRLVVRVQMLVVVVLVVSSVSGFVDHPTARVRSQSDGDEDGKVQIDQSQTIDGVTVWLEWAYVDTSRIEIGVQVEAEGDTKRVNLLKPYLTSADGQLFGQWVVSGEGFNPESSDIKFTTFMRDDVEAISLRIDLLVAVRDMPEDLPYNTSFRGGGSLFDLHPIPFDANRIESCRDYAYESGVFEAENYPIDTWWDRATIEGNGYEIVGPFDFEFDIDILPSGMAIMPDVMVTENNIELRLEDFIIRPPWGWAVMRTPSQLPSTIVDTLFGEQASLTIGDEDWDSAGIYIRQIDSEYCVLAHFIAPPISPNEASEAENVETTQVEVMQTTRLTIPAHDELNETVVRDWVFEFDVPTDVSLTDW